jgi:hypothetical protein
MTISRRARRTDLREGSLDVNNLFVNAQLDSEGKILLPSELDAQEWLRSSVPFSDLYDDNPPSFVNSSYVPDYSFSLPSEIALEPVSEGGSYLIRIYINGLKLNPSSDFNISNQICTFSLLYEIENDDSIELWYVQS